MMDRTIQYRNESYLVVIPKAIIELVGLKAGDKVMFDLKENNIITIQKRS